MKSLSIIELIETRNDLYDTWAEKEILEIKEATMKIDIKTKEEEWYDFDEDTKLQIIPFNFSEINLKDEMSDILKSKLMYYYDSIREIVLIRSDIENDKKEDY